MLTFGNVTAVGWKIGEHVGNFVTKQKRWPSETNDARDSNHTFHQRKPKTENVKIVRIFNEK